MKTSQVLLLLQSAHIYQALLTLGILCCSKVANWHLQAIFVYTHLCGQHSFPEFLIHCKHLKVKRFAHKIKIQNSAFSWKLGTPGHNGPMGWCWEVFPLSPTTPPTLPSPSLRLPVSCTQWGLRSPLGPRSTQGDRICGVCLCIVTSGSLYRSSPYAGEKGT